MSNKALRAIPTPLDPASDAQPAYAVPVYRLQLVKEGSATVSDPITKPEAVARLLADVAKADREQMVALYFNTKLRVVGRHTVSIGTLNATLVHPREVYKAALMANAHGVALSHNHPSGELTPSADDDELTRRIARAGRLLDVPLLDHVILSPDGHFYSYKDRRPECLEGGDRP